MKKGLKEASPMRLIYLFHSEVANEEKGEGVGGLFISKKQGKTERRVQNGA